MRDLTKWPRLLVVGKPVTLEQADEILIRTNSWYLTSNDKDFERAVYQTAGIPVLNDIPFVGGDAIRLWEQSLDVLDLSYLHNAQILSSWIGGPHGWCDWNGNIGCSTYNIGKWPSVEGVQADWSKIAAAFPYLTLDAQLVPDEGEADRPAVQWRVEKGEAHLVEPTGLLRPAENLPIESLVEMFRAPGRERGVTLPRLSRALTTARERVNF